MTSEQRQQLGENSNLRGPFARCKSLDSSQNCSIDEISLRQIAGIGLRSDERKYNIDSGQGHLQKLAIGVIRLDPIGSLDGW